VRNLIQTGLWRWMKGSGLERFELLHDSDEWILNGTILTLAEGGASEARYEVSCDDSWNTRRARVSLRDGSENRALEITVEGGLWYENGRLVESLTGCADVDLEWSPSTNTLPIRRLGLAIGKSSGPVIAAWVRFPSLTLEPLPQEYLRISDRLYRYKSHRDEFMAELKVDEEGLILEYEGLWRRETAKLDV
jgi:uncharacterized protein